jgi:biotin carboxylase
MNVQIVFPGTGGFIMENEAVLLLASVVMLMFASPPAQMVVSVYPFHAEEVP